MRIRIHSPAGKYIVCTETCVLLPEKLLDCGVCGGVKVGERLREWVGEASTLGVRLVPPDDLRSSCEPRTPDSQRTFVYCNTTTRKLGTLFFRFLRFFNNLMLKFIIIFRKSEGWKKCASTGMLSKLCNTGRY